MLSSICAVRGSKKSNFIRKQEAEGLLSMILIKFWYLAVINTTIDKNCCYPNVFIQIFIMIMDIFQKAEKKQL